MPGIGLKLPRKKVRGSWTCGVLRGEGCQKGPQQKDRGNMKKLSYPIIAAVAGLLIVSASPARAGGSSSCCDDGIAASPKVSAMLNERCKSQCAAPAQAIASTIKSSALVAASPKVQQMRSERPSATVIQAAPETAGYRPTGWDGVTASPKVRAMLDEHSRAVEVAPLK